MTLLWNHQSKQKQQARSSKKSVVAPARRAGSNAWTMKVGRIEKRQVRDVVLEVFNRWNFGGAAMEPIALTRCQSINLFPGKGTFRLSHQNLLSRCSSISGKGDFAPTTPSSVQSRRRKNCPRGPVTSFARFGETLRNNVMSTLVAG